MASACVVQFQPIRALQNAGGEQEWVMNTLRLILGTAVITDALQLFLEARTLACSDTLAVGADFDRVVVGAYNAATTARRYV